MTSTYGLPSSVDVAGGGGAPSAAIGDAIASFDTYGAPSKSNGKTVPSPAPGAGGEADVDDEPQELLDLADLAACMM